MYALVLIGDPGDPDHEFRSGKDLLSIDIDLELDELGSNCQFSIFDHDLSISEKYFKIIYDNELEPPIVSSNYQRITGDAETAIQSINQNVETREERISDQIKVGQQISIEIGSQGVAYLRYEFLHDGINLDFDSRTLTFTGCVASKIATQYKKNTAYTNIDFKSLAEIIMSDYGLKVLFDPLKNNPTYEYIPQIGISDYQFILYEAKRLGYRVISARDTVTFYGTDLKEENTFTIRYKDNLINCDFSFETDPVGSENIRSSVSESTTKNQRKWKIGDNGLLVPLIPENDTGGGNKATTGSNVEPVTPKEADPVPIENEKRVKGLVMNFSTPLDPLSAKVTLDTGIIVDGISDVLDRVFIPESISFKYAPGQATVNVSAYSPLKPKYKELQPPPTDDLAFPADLPAEFQSAVGGGSVNARLMAAYRQLGGFETRSVASRYGISPTVACVAAMNHLYSRAGLSPLWGQSLAVNAARGALRNAGARPLRNNQIIAGDIHIVLRADGFAGHIGLCLGNGQVVSNSSSRAAFVWISPYGFPPSYRGAPIVETYRDPR